MDEDFLFAVKLQQQFDNENKKKRKLDQDGPGDVDPNHALSIVDPSWEMLDPNPDLRSMFLQFNHKFFWNTLGGVEVKWSPRMTLCAGVCSYEGRGGLCSIRLSEPLLKLRPRKDLVETLLHEMIHAFLFVTQNDRDRDGHGPEFCKHMNRINKSSGTNITIYHTFHDEVDNYRQHWWRCNGRCQNRKPYFGYVKRAMNRAPSSLDPWWEDHRKTCGGTYTKVKEPEGYGKKNKKNPEKSKPTGSQDLRNFLPFGGKGFLLGGNATQSSTSALMPPPPKKPHHAPSTPTPISPKKPHHAPSMPTPISPKKPNHAQSTPTPISPRKPHQAPSTPTLFHPKKPNHASSTPVLFSPKKPDHAPSTPISPKKTNLSPSMPTPPPPKKPPHAPSTAVRPPSRTSVGNTKVFTNVNGSPVKSQRGSRGVQRSIQELFSKTHVGAPPTSAGPAPSAFVITVHCPVCQLKVEESKINEHLDSCLS